MGTENSVGDSVFAGLIGRWHSCGIVDESLAIFQVNAIGNQFYHNKISFVLINY